MGVGDEQGAAVGLFEQPRTTKGVAVGRGAEQTGSQFRFHGIGHEQKRPGSPGGQLMDEPGQDPASAAALPDQEHGRVDQGGPLGFGAHHLQGRACARRKDMAVA